MTIAEVLLPVPLDKTFDYQLTTTAKVGQRVLVEFGQSRQLVGLITAFRQQGKADETNTEQQIKPILAVLDDITVVDKPWWDLIRFASRYYAEPLGKAFKNALPARLRANESLHLVREQCFSLSTAGQTVFIDDTLPKNARRQRRLLALLHEHSNATAVDLRAAGLNKADIDKALNSGYLLVDKRSPYTELQPVQRVDYALNDEQQQAVDTIGETFGRFATHLLDGVTGSGKTEVYIHLIERAIQQQRQILLLVPEIGLTPQMLARFTARFGRRVAAYHSGLSDKARRDIFICARQGELPILIGTRSAIFVPMPDLGLILIDEEHDLSYKQQDGFLYHARDLAVYRGKCANIPVIMGSATPSLESLYNVQRGVFQLQCLNQRATGAALPEMFMVDRRGHGREQVLAEAVQQKMRQTLQRGEQVLLFLNRRGFAPIMRCNACGWGSDCPACSVHQTAHVSKRQLCCHHCGHSEALPLRCPDCGDKALYFAGAGTEKLESQLNEQFPQYRVLRLDRDKQTTAKQLDNALAEVHRGNVDIIVGTQLVVKGHHFTNVTLVCVVDADSALFSSDFRAEERLYQQLIQVSGRAGRESLPGQVYIQSTVPEHEVFHALLKHNYRAYAEQLLVERESSALPPYAAVAVVKATAKAQTTVLQYLRAIKQVLAEYSSDLMVLGPVPLAVERVNNRYQAKLWLSAADKAQLQKALPLLQRVITHFDASRRYKTVVDVDAISP